MAFALRIDGVCQKCMQSLYDKHGRCRPCAAIRRRVRRTGLSWEEASKFEFKPKIGYEGEMSSKQKYLLTPKGKAYSRRWAASRRAMIESTALLKGDEWNDFFIKEIYSLSATRELETGVTWHVDHILPLKGESVTGLHVWYNLQLIPAKLNIQKGNNFG